MFALFGNLCTIVCQCIKQNCKKQIAIWVTVHVPHMNTCTSLTHKDTGDRNTQLYCCFRSFVGLHSSAATVLATTAWPFRRRSSDSPITAATVTNWMLRVLRATAPAPVPLTLRLSHFPIRLLHPNELLQLQHLTLRQCSKAGSSLLLLLLLLLQWARSRCRWARVRRLHRPHARNRSNVALRRRARDAPLPTPLKRLTTWPQCPTWPRPPTRTGMRTQLRMLKFRLNDRWAKWVCFMQLSSSPYITHSSIIHT